MKRRLRRGAGRLSGGGSAVAVLLGAALSVGGLSDTLGSVRFLETVRIFGEGGREAGAGGFRGADVRQAQETTSAEFFAEAIPYGQLIHEKARKYDVDPALVAAVIEHESRFHPGAKSQKGARGLMQLMPRTGRLMGAENLYDPEQNIDAGVKYIKYLHGRFGGDLNKTMAAYNAGEAAVERYRGVPPYRETRQYVKKVLSSYDRRTREIREYRRDQPAGGSEPEPDGTFALR